METVKSENIWIFTLNKVYQTFFHGCPNTIDVVGEDFHCILFKHYLIFTLSYFLINSSSYHQIIKSLSNFALSSIWNFVFTLLGISIALRFIALFVKYCILQN